MSLSIRAICRRPRFAILLPVLVVSIAFPVRRWQDYVQARVPPKMSEYPIQTIPTFIYEGLNAPAVLFERFCVTYLPIYRVDHAPPSVLGVGAGDLLFFSGVGILWATVGALLDRRRNSKPEACHKMTLVKIVLVLFLLLVGGSLFYGGFWAIRESLIELYTWHPRRGSPARLYLYSQIAEGTLFILWSALFLVSSAVQILTWFPRKNPSPLSS